MKRNVALAIAVLFSSWAAHAQEGGLPLWELGVFAGGVSTPAYPGSVDRVSRTLVLPTVVYRGEILRSDRSGIGARLFRSEDVELDVGFSASLPASSDAVPARKGMPDLGTLVEFGPGLKWTVSRPTPSSRLRLELPLRSVLEVQGGVREQGVAFEPTLIYETRDAASGWSFAASTGLVVGDSRLNQYFYGVEPVYATPSRAAYSAQAGLIATRLGFTASRAMTPDLRLFAFARFESYGAAANRTSPLFLESAGHSVGLGLSWTLGRSATRVAN